MNEKKFIFSLKSNIAVIAALVVVTGISVGIFVSSIMEYHALRDAKENIDNEKQHVQQEIDRYKHDIDAEMNDEYIESVAKDELGLINPDEIIIND